MNDSIGGKPMIIVVPGGRNVKVWMSVIFMERRWQDRYYLRHRGFSLQCWSGFTGVGLIILGEPFRRWFATGSPIVSVEFSIGAADAADHGAKVHILERGKIDHIFDDEHITSEGYCDQSCCCQFHHFLLLVCQVADGLYKAIDSDQDHRRYEEEKLSEAVIQD